MDTPEVPENINDVPPSHRSEYIIQRKKEEAEALKQCKANWQIATRKRAINAQENNKKSDNVEIPPKKGAEGKNSRNKPRAPKDNPEAVLIKPVEDRSYTDILKSLKNNVKLEKTEIAIHSIRKTTAGAVLLEIGKGGKKAEFCESIKETLKEIATVKDLRPQATIEIRDLDCLTDEEEVITAIRSATQNPTAEMKVHVTKANSREQCRAFVKMAITDVKSILEKSRIKVGWTICRVKLRADVKRCFKCFGVGHVQANCTGPDRKGQGLCIRCGEKGRKFNECTKPPKCCLCLNEGLIARSWIN
ncbi:uncharacterized protein LOC119665865 [Teleopsis dalmanni]|uniref:uncharacterized protein LOC119665865 n=1 Tax=Teleopsis dalmanni TaxID=139649 RepID=UPI0018CD48CA|nr:uncharacterized protein LOC119665865 [Teleopsis dalmanni]